MSKLSFQAIKVIKRAYDVRSTEVPFNNTWQQLHEEYRIGQHNHRHLVLTPQDWRILREIVKKDSDYDLQQPLPTGSRTEVAAQVSNEKWSRESIRENRIFASSCTPITLHKGSISLAGTGVAWIDWRELVFEHITHLVMIENQECIAMWGNFMLPSSLKRALAVYRGHDISARAVGTLLNALPATIPVVWFADFDPAGFVIAMASPRCDALLVPADPYAVKTPKLTKRYDKQWTHYSESGASLPVSFAMQWDVMTEKSIALSQELLCARQVPLEIIWRDPAQPTS